MHTAYLIVPCFNEEQNILPFYTAVKEVFSSQLNEKQVDFEIVFVDDGSSDDTFNKISELSRTDKRVKSISFSRNFGKEAALFSGIRYAAGRGNKSVTGGGSDCAIILDADLQHPVSVIPSMVEKWLEGCDVIEGVKTDRGKETLFHKIFSKIFYNLISSAVGFDMRNSSDFKLLDMKVLKELAALKERNTFFRALSFWVGFKKDTVYYEVLERNSGVSKWSVKSLVKYAVKNVICFSYTPLLLVNIFGVIFILFGIIFAADAIISFLRGTAAAGYPTLLFLLFIGMGVIMLSLGIIGIYIAQIYDEVKSRPQYIIGKKID